MTTSRSVSLELVADRQAMQRFADLSGDHSSLHMDPAHGARSRFGENVVHGVLPLLALPLLLKDLALPADLWIAEIEARFPAPLAPGRPVRLTATWSPADATQQVQFELSGDGGRPLTRGSLTFREGVRSAVPDRTVGPSSLLPQALSERVLWADEMRKGERSSFPYVWGDAQGRAMREVLSGMLKGVPEEELNTAVPGPSGWAFACLALLSTQVGMVMPGRAATLLEFQLRIPEQALAPHGSGTVRSEVKLASQTSGTLVQDVEFLAEDTVLASAQVKASVARRPYAPPAMAELAKRVADRGLKDKVVLISGASRGLGAVTAKLFAAHGARVVVNFRTSQEAADQVVSDIQAHGGQAMAVHADITEEKEVAAMMAQVHAAWGNVDVLVNNAVAGYRSQPIEETSWAHVQQDIDVVVKGSFLLVQAVLRGFEEQGGGRIVNISSTAVEAPPRSHARYVIAKSALSGLTRSLAVELAGRNVLVNEVVPSFMETDLTSGTDRVSIGQIKAASPMKRLPSPEEVADVIVFLASPQAAHMSGQRLVVTGGAPPFL
ncbi:MAG: SDR family oxidoreductase [Flavobacteriales bacterium]|nr:SDR family oxidoreductase [Flavobacteriales bacterium]MCB9199701.1 SDR family oxidoreductase [Flavobacteriales bacterium]